ncbi:hypothetical protein STEG23_004601 [Scotinomys teguina]
MWEDLGWVLQFSNLKDEQSYAPAPHPMAPPSPSTNSSSNSSGEQLSKTNLYIRGLPPGTTDQDLIKLCQPIEMLKLPLDNALEPIVKQSRTLVSHKFQAGLKRTMQPKMTLDFSDSPTSASQVLGLITAYDRAESQPEMCPLSHWTRRKDTLHAWGREDRYGKIVSTKAILDKNTNQCKVLELQIILMNKINHSDPSVTNDRQIGAQHFEFM